MDGERVGPLSYSVTAPEGEASAQRAILLGAGAIAGLVFLSLVGGWFVLGVSRSAGVVVNGGTFAILLAPVGVALLSSRDSLKRTRRNALAVVAVLAVLAAFFTHNVLVNIKPALPQVEAAVDEIKLPPGFRLISSETYGDRLCRRGCPTVERRYAAPESDKDPVSTMILSMFSQGWERTSDVEPRFATTAAKDGLSAQLGENDPHIVDLRVTRGA